MKIKNRQPQTVMVLAAASIFGESGGIDGE
jgi:hypothetical protein